MNLKSTSHLSSIEGMSYYPWKTGSDRGKKHCPFVNSQGIKLD
jgi:hypothetical protein